MRDSRLIALLVAMTEALNQDRIRQKTIAPLVVAEFGMIPEAYIPFDVEAATKLALEYVTSSYNGNVPSWFRREWVSDDW